MNVRGGQAMVNGYNSGGAGAGAGGRFQAGQQPQRKISAESSYSSASSSRGQAAFGASNGSHLERRPIKYESQ